MVRNEMGMENPRALQDQNMVKKKLQNQQRERESFSLVSVTELCLSVFLFGLGRVWIGVFITCLGFSRLFGKAMCGIYII